MKYCENCYCLSTQERCPLCGNKRLRQVREDDFCLLLEENTAYCNMLMEVFKENGIDYSVIPYGDGTRTRLGLPLENYRLFVPYHAWEEAKELIRQIEAARSEELKVDLLKNIESFNILSKEEKKIRKRLKLPKDADIFDYCIDAIRSADKIVDEGIITTCPKAGHYLFCISDNVTLCINSKTYEILSLTENK